MGSSGVGEDDDFLIGGKSRFSSKVPYRDYDPLSSEAYDNPIEVRASVVYVGVKLTGEEDAYLKVLARVRDCTVAQYVANVLKNDIRSKMPKGHKK